MFATGMFSSEAGESTVNSAVVAVAIASAKSAAVAPARSQSFASLCPPGVLTTRTVFAFEQMAFSHSSAGTIPVLAFGLSF